MNKMYKKNAKAVKNQISCASSRMKAFHKKIIWLQPSILIHKYRSSIP